MPYIAKTGARVKVLWTKDKVGDSGWKAEWYICGYKALMRKQNLMCVFFVLNMH